MSDLSVSWDDLERIQARITDLESWRNGLDDWIQARITDLESWRNGLDDWRRELEAELGEERALDLGGAVLEDHERQAEAEERDLYLGPVPGFSRPVPAPAAEGAEEKILAGILSARPRVDSETLRSLVKAVREVETVAGEAQLDRLDFAHLVDALAEALGRSAPAETPPQGRPAERDADVTGPALPRPLTTAEVEACRLAAVEDGPSRPPPEPAIVPGERPRSFADHRPFSVRLDGVLPVAIVDAQGWDVLHLSPSARTMANVGALVAALNQAETPLQKLARQVADAAASWTLVDDSECDPEFDRLRPLIERWITESGFALKAEGPG